MTHIHSLAEQQKLTPLSDDVSISAKEFFKKKGKVDKQQAVSIREQVLTHFKMSRSLQAK